MAHGVKNWRSEANVVGVGRATLVMDWMLTFVEAVAACILISTRPRKSDIRAWSVIAQEFRKLAAQRINLDSQGGQRWRQMLPSQPDFFHPIAEVIDGTYTPFDRAPGYICKIYGAGSIADTCYQISSDAMRLALLQRLNVSTVVIHLTHTSSKCPLRTVRRRDFPA
jgi:hypothetical protein